MPERLKPLLDLAELFCKREENLSADLDGSEVTGQLRELIKTKPLLRSWYKTQYEKYLKLVRSHGGATHIEIGSGGGFLKEMAPDVRTSSYLDEDVACGLVDCHLDAMNMDLPNESVDSFFLLGVLHHIKDPCRFFQEAHRCLKCGGFILMVEPANTVFSRFILKNFHPESFDERARTWVNPYDHHLSNANGAVPSLVFERDRAEFEKLFPELKVVGIRHHTFLSYILSGGWAHKSPVPPSFYWMVDALEKVASPLMSWLAMNMDIHLVKGSM